MGIKSVHEGIKSQQACFCKECGKEYQSKKGLEYHTQTVHKGSKSESALGIKPLKIEKCVCKECSQEFDSNYNLRKHIETVHEGVKIFKCNKCDKCGKEFPHIQTRFKILCSKCSKNEK